MKKLLSLSIIVFVLFSTLLFSTSISADENVDSTSVTELTSIQVSQDNIVLQSNGYSAF